MNWRTINPLTVLRGFLGFLFIYSAIGKILDRESFVNDLLKARYIDMEFLPWLIWLVPLLEFITVALLLSGRTIKSGLLISLFMLSVFTLHLVLIRNINPMSPCSCGVLFSFLSPAVHLYFNSGMVMIIMYALLIWSPSASDGL